MKNKSEFFEKIIKNNTFINEIELSNESMVEVRINGMSEIQNIAFHYDFSENIVLVDGVFRELNLILDTTNIEKIGREIAEKLNIEDEIDSWKFIFCAKNAQKLGLFSSISIRKFDSNFKLLNNQENYNITK